MLPDWTKRLLAGAAVIPVVYGTAVSASALATAETQDTRTAPVAASNHGEDLTRPLNSFETRLNDETTASPTSQTNRATLILRLNTKVTFDDGWKLAMLAQIPVVEESTVTFEPSGSEHLFGLGNAVAQIILSHAIDERWAFGVGARLVARTISDDLGNEKWQIMRGLACVIPSSNGDQTVISFQRCAML